MYSGAIQFLAVGLFAACLYHSWRTEGRKYAQQWFLGGYLFALLQELVLVQARLVSYSDRMLQFGSAPTLTSLLIPSLVYIAYVMARSLSPAEQARPMIYTIFLLTPALALPLDATALQFDWWSFPSTSPQFLNGVPYFMPLAWGLSGALFYAYVRFVRGIRFRGSGQLFAIILGAPFLAGVSVVLIVLTQLVVTLLGLIQNDLLLAVLMGVLLLALPVALVFGIPQSQFPKR